MHLGRRKRTGYNSRRRIAGCLDAHSGRLITGPRSAFEHQTFLRYLLAVEARYPQAERISIALDNWPVHFQPDMLARLQSSKIRLLFLPTYARFSQPHREGLAQAKQLSEEIQAQGFSGTVRIVQRFVQALRDDPEKITLAPDTSAERFSANAATWLFIRDPKQLTIEKQAELELICQHSETARKTYVLTQQFMSMLRLRRGQEFERWLSAVEASQIPELRRFAQGLFKDKSAVVAGLTLSYSNGPVEAQVQKLKLVKRSMFGRAKLPLLRQRLLHAA